MILDKIKSINGMNYPIKGQRKNRKSNQNAKKNEFNSNEVGKS